MDDLISRKALDDAFTDMRWKKDGTLAHFGDRPDWCMHGCEVAKLIQNAPSVPAVPLDKLCEWLEENAGLPTDDYMISNTAGNRKLKQWMEEQHDNG